MGFLLGCEKVGLSYPTKAVFDAVSLGVDEGDRIGIVGRNGDGKSTLLKILSGAIEPDSGRVVRRGGVTVGVLRQADALDDEATVEHEVVGAMPRYEWASDARIRAVISGLISDIPWEGRIGDLSGGQRRRVDLARLLIGTWDVLMLDEPTNHLDVRAIAWLADHLAHRWPQGSGALLAVTHDRWFLDEVCLRMWEVVDRGIEPFEGGFSAYVLQRVERDRLAAQAETKRRNLMRKELAWLSRGARARSSKPKFHLDIARELIAREPPVRDALELKQMAMARLGKQVVELEGVRLALGGRTILDGVDWMIGPGDRIGLVGENGAGKTTLLRIISGDMPPDAGKVRIGKTVRFAMLSQHLHELDEVSEDRVRVVIERCRKRSEVNGQEISPGEMLERLGFEKQQLNTPVKDLSGGQRRRLQLLLILLEEPNVLILDEPGNDLDTDMLAAMEDLLDGWPGTLVVVTHDRYLMERVTDDQFALIDGGVRHLPGGVDEYLSLAQEEERRARSSREKAAAPAADRPGDVGGSSRLSGAQSHAARKRLASLERKADALSERIDEARERMGAADPSDYEALGSIQAEVCSLEGEKKALEEEWFALAESLGEA